MFDEEQKEKILLRLEEVTQEFGEFKAVNSVSFNVKKGELSSIIGPNGAGKTTLFNTICGKYKPTNGQVIFNNKNITGLPIYEIAKLGLGKTFQITSIFPTLTVYENLQSTLISKENKGTSFFRDVNTHNAIHERIIKMVHTIGLEDKIKTISANLTHGDQKILDIALALIQDPLMLLLDEPTSGMAMEEKKRMIKLIENLWKTFGVTIVFIEHDIDIVFEISQIIRVMHEGKLLAEGIPSDIKKNKSVKEAYLGKE